MDFQYKKALEGLQGPQENFLRTYSTGHLPHAWLFAGPEGIGKASFAIQCARLLLAPQQDMQEEDGGFMASVKDETRANHLIDMNTHPDLRVLTNVGEDNKPVMIGVDEVRQLISFIQRTTEGRKVVLIDGVENMTLQATNALLKILEEPSPGVVFLLVTHAPGQLLDTVRSRCRLLSFKDAPLVSFQKIFPDLADVSALHDLANGRIGVAHQLLIQEGLMLYDAFLGAMESSVTGSQSLTPVYEFAKLVMQDKSLERYKMFRLFLSGFFKRLIAFSWNLKGQESFSEREQAVMTGFLDTIPTEKLWDIHQQVAQKFKSQAELNLDPKQILINTFFNLKSFQKVR